ncbi:hypothetical protein C2I36_04195 [Rhodobacteraceae bacterium WD3A24]|nr:hypothetical protein C2I36_04195 [Rhodobacteraceae bacterium WD3A24]
MRATLLATTVLSMFAGGAQAAGIERSAQSMAILFEEGRHAQLSFSHVNPDVSGRAPALLGGRGSGEVLDDYATFALGYKMALGERLDLALILDQPIGADIAYPTGTGYPLEGTTATIDTNAVTGVLRYRVGAGLSVHGGLRVARTEGDVDLRFPAFGPAGYQLSTSRETDAGYLLGLAYERPEIGLRIALTYNSQITHDFDATETVLGASFETGFETTIPESVNLEFQTGIAPDTLLFGSVRWVNWPDFEIAPTVYTAPRSTGGLGQEPLVYYDDETVTYNLGIGRRFSEHWSGALTLGYETRMDPPEGMGNLGPTDGRESIGLALTHTRDNVSITGGVEYIAVGDTTTRTVEADFDDNHALAMGVEIGVSF